MKTTIIVSTFGLAAVLTVVRVSTTVAAQSGANTQAGSTVAQTVTVKGSIVIRTAQESDYPRLATVPLQQAIQTALVQLPGGLLKAETKEEHGALVHHIEIVGTDKTITEFTIDAGTGAVLAKSVDKADDDKREGSDDDEDDD
jgi:uncharacterized membrane protein YkoI